MTSDSQKNLALAVHRALDILGEQSKEYILHYMNQHHGIRFDESGDDDDSKLLLRPTVERVENALTDILGAGAIRVIIRLRAELAK